MGTTQGLEGDEMVFKQTRRFSTFVTVAAAYFTAWFFCCTFLYAQENRTSVEMFRDQLDHSVGTWLLCGLLFCLLTILYSPFASGQKKVRRTSVWLGLVYAVLFTIGICQQCSANEDFFIPGAGADFRLGQLAAWSLFFACCVELLNQKLDSMECPCAEGAVSRRTFFAAAHRRSSQNTSCSPIHPLIRAGCAVRPAIVAGAMSAGRARLAQGPGMSPALRLRTYYVCAAYKHPLGRHCPGGCFTYSSGSLDS